MIYIDTHTHIDGEEFRDDLDAVVGRAREAGAEKLFVPGINWDSVATMKDVCSRYPGYILPMIGLHPEEVREDYEEVLQRMYAVLQEDRSQERCPWIAIGEVGLDYYWSREYEKEQMEAFERQVEWSIETRLPLMIHCRKAQNEMVRMLRSYAKDLPGGVFHCFTGNSHEAEELLQFDGFALGIGGVCTFRKSHLAEDLAASVPLSRIVLETDSPYMAPVPHRGKRNEPSFIPYIIQRLAEAYQVEEQNVAEITTSTARRIFLENV